MMSKRVGQPSNDVKDISKSDERRDLMNLRCVMSRGCPCVQNYPKFSLEDVTNASEYVYCLENCDISSGDMKLSEHMHNHI
jgi:hypothetical protein